MHKAPRLCTTIVQSRTVILPLNYFFYVLPFPRLLLTQYVDPIYERIRFQASGCQISGLHSSYYHDYVRTMSRIATKNFNDAEDFAPLAMGGREGGDETNCKSGSGERAGKICQLSFSSKCRHGRPARSSDSFRSRSSGRQRRRLTDAHVEGEGIERASERGRAREKNAALYVGELFHIS